MNMSVSGMKIAVLASSGFEEGHYITIQKALSGTGAVLKIVSTDHGVISGLTAQGWGHNHPIDASLNTALGVDYSAIIIPGGKGSHAKLAATAHTKRFIGSFLTAQKPVIALGDAVELLAGTGQMSDAVLVGETLNDSFMTVMIDYLLNNADMEEAA